MKEGSSVTWMAEKVGQVTVHVPRGFALKSRENTRGTDVYVELAPTPPAGTADEAATDHLLNALYMLELELEMQNDPTPPRCVGTISAAAQRIRTALAKIPEGL